MRHSNFSIFGLAAAFVLLWNSGFIGAEYGLPYTKPLTLLFWRYAVLAILLGIFIKLRGRVLWPGLNAVAHASFVGILAHGVWLGCVFMAIERGVPVGIVALIVALQPLMTGAFSGIVVNEPTDLYQWFGLLLGFCGVVIAVDARLEGDDNASFVGYLLPFGSVVAITAATLFQRRQETAGKALPVDTELVLSESCYSDDCGRPSLIDRAIGNRMDCAVPDYPILVDLRCIAWRLRRDVVAARQD